MRADFGLPPLERSIGQSAHDVFQLMASGEVFLTRARKISGVVQVPSRWLVRMQILVEGQQPELWQSMQVTDHYRTLLSFLDKPELLPAYTKPKPLPPIAMRPTSLSTTAIEKFTRNPYDCYAETILRLRPLDPLEEEPSSKHFGQVIHRTMEQFSKRHPKGLPANIRNELRECAMVAFAQMLHWPAVKALWWPRFESILPWLEQAERESRVLSSTVLAEQNVKWQLPCGDSHFAITSRIDRLDIRHDGTIGIVDYKTGSPPTKADIDRAEINQLALYALCLSHGELLVDGHSMPHDYASYTLHYWRLAGRVSDCVSQQVITDLGQAREKLTEVIKRYRDPDYAFESHDDPTIGFRGSAYEHLNRRAEWDSL
jgi:ATP-dependent helicase/nuclease subunit B